MVSLSSLDTAILRAVAELSPHAGWTAISRLAGVQRDKVKGALDRLQDQRLIAPGHWHEDRQHESVTDAGRAALAQSTPTAKPGA